ncbi:MAG TPA: hypothetical protein VL049_01515 [Candidatus Dormibacteraeota bacterium]|nr:hypothetical protein [Candidatus Dormibacteraeota bacterium]
MLTIKKLSLLGVAAAACWLVCAPFAQAETFSDTGAAVLVWPKIVVGPDTDTVIQMTNQAAVPSAAHCFYVNANNRCTNTGLACSSSTQCEEDGFFGACLPGWIEINFDVFLTKDQPVAWSAADGFGNGDLPCPGGIGSKCSGNGGTRVPPVGETPFIGELKCIQSDPITRLPFACNESQDSPCRNDLEGGATITNVASGAIDPERYNAVGLRTFGKNNGDNTLVIGGPQAQAEYQPCSEVLVFNHLFDGAIDPLSDPATPGVASSELSLVPCTQDFLIQQVPSVTAQFLVYNEFEQRFSTSRLVRCLLDSPISQIDTSQPSRSIFSAAVSGTVAGQTRITGVGGGLIGSATLSFSSTANGTGGSAYNLNQFADRDEADFIRIP